MNNDNTDPRPHPISEINVLLESLNAQRRHVLGIPDGLDDAALRRAVLPSGWNCLGLVQHLALDDERLWFQAVVAGDQTVIDQVMNTSEDSWQVGFVILHVLTETAVHAGHLDATRELIDGRTWLVLD